MHSQNSNEILMDNRGPKKDGKDRRLGAYDAMGREMVRAQSVIRSF